MELTTLTFEKSDAVGTITLNRPSKLNAINFTMLDELWQLLLSILEDDTVRIVVFTGAGKFFSSGADLGILSTLTPANFRKMQREHWNKVFGLIESFNKLTIAAINGPAVGGAVELALCCDFRYAADDASFTMPQVNYGIIPDAGGTIRLPLLIGLPRAKELIMSGESIDAGQAAAWGLVNRTFPAPDFPSKVREVALGFAQKPPLAIQQGKGVMNKGFQHRDIQIGLQDAMDAQTVLVATEDYREGIAAFFEKRQPRFQGK